MAKIKVTIVGLGAIGCSIGLALQQSKADVELVGHDKEPLASREALKLGAVHKTHWNLLTACDGADLVILALPLRAIEDTLKALAAELKPDCVIMDTATVKTPVLQWAKDILPANIHFVATNPIVATDGRGSKAAKADLFREAPWVICGAPTTASDAMQLATDTVIAMGASPYYMDAGEHDGLLAATDHLPLVLGAAVLNAITKTGTLEQMSKVGGPAIARVTSPVMTEVEIARDVCLLNGPNVVRWVENLQQTLEAAKATIASGDEAAITTLFRQAQDDWVKWLKGDQTESMLDRDDLMPSWRTTLFGRMRLPESRRKTND